MYTLYSIPGSCSSGIVVLMQKLGLEFDVINPTQIENYKSVSPTGQVPALVDGDLVVTEGAAIALYLLRKHSQSDVEDPTFLRWLMFNYATLHPAYSKLFSVNGLMEDSDQKTALMQSLGDKLTETWAIVDARLAKSDAVVGDQATIIDYLLAVYTGWNAYFPGVKINVGDNVRALVSRVAELPEFKAGFAKENAEFKSAA